MEASATAAGETAGAAPRNGGDGGKKGASEGSATWALSDRIGLAICWVLGLLFCAIAVAVVVYLLIQGIKFLQPEMLWTPASAGFTETQSGGFSDALIGTLIVAVMGLALALPVGVAIAVWLVEYGRPAGARAGHRVDDRGDRRHPLDRARPVRHA